MDDQKGTPSTPIKHIDLTLEMYKDLVELETKYTAKGLFFPEFYKLLKETLTQRSYDYLNQ